MSSRYVAAWLVPAMLTLFLIVGLPGQALTERGEFVGSAACADCHAEEYENYMAFSKKAHSGNAVKTMAKDLTPEETHECFACHSTGYGKPGGFTSFEETPEMANAGCEVCHGPGSEHVDSWGDPQFIKGDLSVQDCEHCHNPERVAAFDYKPLVFGGAH